VANISNNDIARAIFLTTKGKTGSELGNALRNSVKFLAQKRLLSKSGEIIASLEKIVNEESNTIVAKVATQRRLDHKELLALKHLLKERYKAHEVILKEQVDQRLLGGMRIEVDDEVIDLSLKHKVNTLEEYLIKGYE
jgi:F-type H+-transporting ATPase subunit delta